MRATNHPAEAQLIADSRVGRQDSGTPGESSLSASIRPMRPPKHSSSPVGQLTPSQVALDRCPKEPRPPTTTPAAAAATRRSQRETFSKGAAPGA